MNFVIPGLGKAAKHANKPYHDSLNSEPRVPQTNLQKSEQYSSSAPAEKKRKLDHARSTQSEDSFRPGVAIPRRQSVLPADTYRSRKGAEKTLTCGSQEMRAFDKFISVGRHGGHSKRKRRDNKDSTRSSPHSTPLARRIVPHFQLEGEARDLSMYRPPSGSEQDDVVIDREVIVVNQDQEHSDAARPPINLARGLDTTTALSKHRRLSSGTHTGASSTRTSPPRNSRWVDAESATVKSISPLRIHRNDQIIPVPKPGESNPDDSNLRKRFVRYDDQSRAVEDIEDDQDELSGPTNIHGRPDDNHVSSRPNRSKKPRSSSPSDLPQTTFSTRTTVKRLSPAKPIDHAEGTETRIPVRSLVCSSMQLSSENIELVWDSQLCWFHVLHNGQRQRVPGRDDFASIGPKIQKIISNKASPKVLLKCAAYPFSNGNILIDFETLVRKEDFIVQVLKSTRPVPDQTNYDREHFKKTFQKLGEIFSTRPAHRAQPDHVLGRHQPSHDVSDVEEIVYEREDSDEERSANSVLTRDQPSKPAMFGHESHDTRRKPEDDEATNPSFREEDKRVTRRSLGVSKPVARITTPPRWTQCNDLTSWRHSVVYPPLPALRRVTVDKEDIGRLDEGEFLNDTILSFALRKIEESMAPQRREEIYMFNTFFYTALSTKLGRKAFNFDAVKSWTRKVDIFKYPFVVVPINVSLHWFVAIICNLPSVRSPPQDDAAMDDVEEIEPVDDRKQHLFNAANVDAIEPSEPDDDSKSSQPPNARMSQLSLQDGDGRQPGDARTKKLNKTRKYGSKKHAPPVKKMNPKGPFIITLDSLNLARSPEVRYLKDYIAAEAMDKLDIVLDSKEFQGVTAKGIPEQNNFCDCGIFAVRYIRALAEDPHGFVKDILDRRVSEERFKGFNPSEVRDELRSDLLELSRVNEEEFKAKREQKLQLKRGAPQQTDKHGPPATSPVQPPGKGGESPERPETPVALGLVGAHPSTDSTMRGSTQQRSPKVVSPPSRPGHKASLSESSAPGQPMSRDTDALEF